MATVVGHLQVLMSADSAQITSDLGKARAAVRATANEIKGMGSVGSTWSVLSREVDGLGHKLEGARHGAHAARESLALFGIEGSSGVTKVSNALVGLVSAGFTPLGLALAATTAGISLLAAESKEAEEAAARLEERHKAETKALEDLTAAQRRLSEERAAARSVGIAKETGAPSGIAQAMEGVEAAERAIREMERTRPSWMAQSEWMRGPLEQRLAEARAELDRQRTLSLLRGEHWEPARPIVLDDSEIPLGEATPAGQTIVRPRPARRPTSPFSTIGEDSQQVKDLLREQADAAERLRRVQVESAAAAAGTSAREEELRRRIAEQEEAITAELGIENTTREAIVASYREELALLQGLRAEKTAAAALHPEDPPARRREGLRAVDDPTRGDDFAAGLHARMQQIATDEARLGRVGAEVADQFRFDVADGVTEGLDAIRAGTKSSSEAMNDFAANFARNTAQVLEQALILRMVGAIFGAAGGGAATASVGGSGSLSAASSEGIAASWAAGDAMAGGVVKRASAGGLDGRLVQMKLSPGEVMKMTGGGGDRGGDVNVDLVVRPPAVIADEVMARASSQAKAAVIRKGMSRGGRRGVRAGE